MIETEILEADELRFDQQRLMEIMKRVIPMEHNNHTAWNEYLKIGSNLCSLANLLIDETPSKIIRNNEIDVTNIAIILVVLYNSEDLTSQTSAMIDRDSF